MTAAVDLRRTRRDAVAGEIERVAIDLFAARGLDVTVEEIADAAGISPRTFFRYFPTKADVVRAHRRRILERLERALEARPPSEGPFRALREAHLATAQMGPEDRERVVKLGRLLAESRRRGLYECEVERDRIERLVALVADRFPRRVAHDWRPAMVVAVVMAAAETAFRAWLDLAGRRDLGAMMVEAFDLLDAGLLALDEPTGLTPAAPPASRRSSPPTVRRRDARTGGPTAS
jgi:TetR/AcrR family transcriptional regulator, regulator of mycofactocin system